MKNFQAILRFISCKDGSEIAYNSDWFADMAAIEATINIVRKSYPDAVRVIVDIALNPEGMS